MAYVGNFQKLQNVQDEDELAAQAYWAALNKQAQQAAAPASAPAAAPAVYANPTVQSAGAAYEPAVRTDSAGSAYKAALDAANRAQKKAVEQGVNRLESSKTGVNQSYDSLAKQAYAAYRADQNRLPSMTANIATGTADSLKLKGQLGYENNLAASERQRANTLQNIDTDISNLRLSGDTAIAQNAEKYALLAEQAMQQQEQQEYARQLQAEQLAYNRQQDAYQRGNTLSNQAYNRQMQADQTAYERQQDAYKRAVELAKATGD